MDKSCKLGPKYVVQQTFFRRLQVSHPRAVILLTCPYHVMVATLQNMNHNSKHKRLRGDPTVTFVLLRDQNACEPAVRSTEKEHVVVVTDTM